MRNILKKRYWLSTLSTFLWSFRGRGSLETSPERSECIRNLRLRVADVLAVRETEREIPQLRKERNNDFIRPVPTHQSQSGSWEVVRKKQYIPIIRRES